MTTRRDPEALLSAYLEDGMTVLPDRVVHAVLDEVHRTHQGTVFGQWRSRPTSRTAFAAAAVVVVLVAGAAFLVQRGQLDVASPSASPAEATSPPAVVVATPTPTAEVLSLDLTWTKVALDQQLEQVAWLGDRFVLVDDAGAVSTSTDGASWHVLQPGDPDPGYAEMLRGEFVSWQDDVVGWWNPGDRGGIAGQPPVTARDILRIVRPPAEPTQTTPFKGRIQSIGVGPVGIVAQVHSHLDWDAWVASKLGDDWVSRYEEVSFKNGILKITMKKGPGLEVVWADEGFELGDFQDAGFGWHSPDGEAWTLMPTPAWSPDADSGLGFVTGFGDVVGVSDGFIARGVDTACTSEDGCAGMWFSGDGLSWTNIGNVPSGSDGSLVPWMGGALATDGVGRFDFWTSQGGNELQMAADVRAASKQPNEPFDNAIGTGPFGAAIVSIDSQEILVTRGGVDWDIQPMPAAMAADGGGRQATTVAVGERSVLVLVWTGGSQDGIPSLWLGTPEP